MASRARTNSLHVMLSDEEEVRYRELAKRLGYDKLGDFVRALLTSVNERYESEGWASGMIHLEGERLVLRPTDGEMLGTYSFPVIAPQRLWRYIAFLEEERKKREAPSSKDE